MNQLLRRETGNRILLFFISILVCLTGYSQETTPNAQQARRIFDTAYERVFGEQGSKLRYDVNIIGIYKTRGTIWMKGKKRKFVDSRVTSWNDGNIVHMAYRKKKTVEIHDAHSEKRDKYSHKFKFSPDDFNYSISKDPEGLMLTLKRKKKVKGNIKEVRALVAPQNYAPIRLRIKVSFIWTTIKISEFQSGGISDDTFVFPDSEYVSAGWKYDDKR